MLVVDYGSPEVLEGKCCGRQGFRPSHGEIANRVFGVALRFRSEYSGSLDSDLGNRALSLRVISSVGGSVGLLWGGLGEA